MHLRGLSLLGLLGATAVAAACGGKGALPEPISNKVADDPCDPGNGTTSSGSAPPVDAGNRPISIPGGTVGIGFDDMRFSATLAQLLVPAGRTGDLDLVDPSSEQVAALGGFSSSGTYSKDDSFGVTSADEGGDVIYATDRTAGTLSRIDPKSQQVTATLTLAAAPGYVRYVAPTNEVWVTEPGASQIEIVKPTGADGGPGLTHAATLAVTGGAESLEIDAQNGKAFTNGKSTTLSIDVMTHSVTATWPNACGTARGLAIDPASGWVLVVCEEGKLEVLDETKGTMLGAVTIGGGADHVAYDAQRQRAYVPSPATAAMAVVEMGTSGAPKLRGSVDAPSDAHCAVTPGLGQVFVCSPAKGELVFLYDPF